MRQLAAIVLPRLAWVLLLAWGASACVPEAEVPPDAAPVPRCADVGCPDAALCDRTGDRCVCLATGEPVSCRLGG